mmetsp:Transcript_14206/g.42214  ORF Transcript_14206/g.42214 Transcript_14206/m.42214 type:complete len:288 (-) Transcript_14206:452-1315(-)
MHRRNDVHGRTEHALERRAHRNSNPVPDKAGAVRTPRSWQLPLARASFWAFVGHQMTTPPYRITSDALLPAPPPPLAPPASNGRSSSSTLARAARSACFASATFSCAAACALNAASSASSFGSPFSCRARATTASLRTMNVSLSISPRINASTDSSSSSLTRASCAAVKRDRTLDTRVSSPTADASSSDASASAGEALDASDARRLPAGREASSRSIARLRPSASRCSRERSPTTWTSSSDGVWVCCGGCDHAASSASRRLMNGRTLSSPIFAWSALMRALMSGFAR